MDEFRRPSAADDRHSVSYSPAPNLGQRNSRNPKSRPPHIVREIAGHSALDVTMSIYAHTSLEAKYRALTRLDDRIGKESLSSDWRQSGDETDSA
jgi:hypothetical protein